MTTETFTEEAKAMREMLLGEALRLLANEEDAEDVVQDTLLKMWQLRDEPIQNRWGMARVIVRNLSIDRLRHKTPTVDIAEASLAAADDGEALHQEQIERVMQMVGELPTMQQTILRMRHLEGMKMGQIAAIVGTSEDAVRQSLSRARRTIVANYRREQNRAPLWLKVLRTTVSLTAAFLVGWFFYVYESPLDEPKPVAETKPVPRVEPPCKAETLQELYTCYKEQHRPRNNSYKQLKQMKYEER